MGNKVYDMIEALKEEGYDYEEYGVVKSTILLMDEKGYSSHYFNWHLIEETIIKLKNHGVMVRCSSDKSGLFTLVKWK